MRPADLPDRMSRHVKSDGDCLVWIGATQSSGYGSTTNGRGGSALAHRKAWEHINGAIPGDLTIDHLCGQRLCVNVAHMEIVSRSENSRRGGPDSQYRRAMNAERSAPTSNGLADAVRTLRDDLDGLSEEDKAARFFGFANAEECRAFYANWYANRSAA